MVVNAPALYKQSLPKNMATSYAVEVPDWYPSSLICHAAVLPEEDQARVLYVFRPLLQAPLPEHFRTDPDVYCPSGLKQVSGFAGAVVTRMTRKFWLSNGPGRYTW